MGKKTPFYRWGKIQPLPTNQPAASGTTAPGQRYYRKAAWYYCLHPSGTTAQLCGTTVPTHGTTATPAQNR